MLLLLVRSFERKGVYLTFFFTLADACTMTRMSALLVRFFYKAWFFGAYYYWAMWAFIAVRD